MKFGKRILSFFVSMCMILIMLPTVAHAADVASGTCGEKLAWTLNESGVLTIRGSAAMPSWDYEWYVPWYEQSSIITYVTIENGVTGIGDNAFAWCNNLTSIDIPTSVTSIGDNAFFGCSSLRSIDIPNGVTSIGEGAFTNATSISSVVIPESVTNIGNLAFYGCYSLAEIQVSSGNSAYCSMDGVLYSKDMKSLISFPPAKNVTSFSIPDGVATIGDYSFAWCEDLTSVAIPDSVTAIGYGAFCRCDSLTSIEIPDSVTNVGTYAFVWCDSLTSIRFSGQAPAFGSDVFQSVTATCYYPAGDGTWTEDIMQDYGGNITWVAYPPMDTHLPGDINGDGGVNNKDATRLFQHLSGWDVEVVEEALDVNGDGAVNNKDATRLFQYLSGWNVEIL